MAETVFGEIETLNLRFDEEDGVPYRYVDRAVERSVPVVDLSGKPDPQEAARLWMWGDLRSGWWESQAVSVHRQRAAVTRRLLLG